MLRPFLVIVTCCAVQAADDGPDIRFGIIENTRLDDGRHRSSALFLWHRTTNPDGSVDSSHLLNYVQAGEHRMLVPLWFQGPGYAAAPLALSGGWRRDDGGRSLWLTPLFHADHAADGRLESMHLLNWLSGDGYRMLFPLFYQDDSYSAAVPLWFSGPAGWTVPLALSAGWERSDGGSATWVTPLFHVDRDRSGTLDGMHVGPWFHGPRHDILFPLYGTWRNDAGGRTTWVTPLFHCSTDGNGETTSFHLLTWLHEAERDLILPLVWLDHSDSGTTGAVLPLWLGGRNWWAVPPLLSGGGKTADGGRTTWITPLAHRTVSGDGQRSSRHLLNWFSGEDTGSEPSSWQLLAPFYWHDRRTQAGVTTTRTAVLPLWIDGPGWTVVPPALSGRWQEHDGATTTWVTPLFHRTNEADGSLRHKHAGLWWQDPDHRVLFPLWWHWSSEAGTHHALLPLWYTGPNRTIIPPLLSWWGTGSDGGTSTWLTPLFHIDRAADGSVTSLHALNWIQSGDKRMLLPLYYRSPTAQHLLPLWLSNQDGWTAPPLLSWHRRQEDGSASTWITPLFHVSTDPSGNTRSLHALNWFQGPDWQVLFPLAYRGGGYQGIVPLAFSGPGGWVVPPLLSAGWRRPDGGSSTWITPLFHVDRDADGTVDNLHVGPWFQGKDWQVLFPLAYRGSGYQGIVPLVFSGPDGWTVPPLLSAGWRRSDGGSSTWITPLFHLDRDPEGRLEDLHALTWVQGRDSAGLLPLWWHGPRSTVVPPLLSGRWQRDDGGHTTWVTPLFHIGTDGGGRTTDWHALNVIHDGDTTVIAPLAWASGPAEARTRTLIPLFYQDPEHLAVVPLWFSGRDWWTVPLGLAGGWNSGGKRTTMITPFYHRSSIDGVTTSSHLLTWLQTPEMQAVAPLWWDWRTDAGGRRSVLAPLWYQHAGADGAFTATLMPLLFNYRRGAALDDSLATRVFPFRMQVADDGHEYSVLWRLFYLRDQSASTEVQLWPLWWSETHQGAPTAWQILGGMFGRDADRTSRTTLDYAAWGALRFGGRTAYETP